MVITKSSRSHILIKNPISIPIVHRRLLNRVRHGRFFVKFTGPVSVIWSTSCDNERRMRRLIRYTSELTFQIYFCVKTKMTNIVWLSLPFFLTSMTGNWDRKCNVVKSKTDYTSLWFNYIRFAVRRFGVDAGVFIGIVIIARLDSRLRRLLAEIPSTLTMVNGQNSS